LVLALKETAPFGNEVVAAVFPFLVVRRTWEIWLTPVGQCTAPFCIEYRITNGRAERWLEKLMERLIS
jgi:hypothetical protein